MRFLIRHWFMLVLVTVVAVTWKWGNPHPQPVHASSIQQASPCASTTQGLVPATGGGTSNFLRADCTFATPSGTGVGSFTGDGAMSNNSASTGAITFSLANASANKVWAGPTSGGAATPTYRSLVTGDLPVNQAIRSIGGGFDGGGSALTAGATQTTYFTVPFACTVAAWNITVDTGTISFDVWKVGTGTAIPTSANTILSGGYLAIATGTALHSTTLTDFTTTAVTANDIVGVNIEAVASATKASLVIQCNAT